MKKTSSNELLSLKMLMGDVLRPFVPEFVKEVEMKGSSILIYHTCYTYTHSIMYVRITCGARGIPTSYSGLLNEHSNLSSCYDSVNDVGIEQS